MNARRSILTFLSFLPVFAWLSCNQHTPLPAEKDSSILLVNMPLVEDSNKYYYVIDTMGMGKQWDEYYEVKNLLEFHTRDTMKTDSTYLATLLMGKNISSAELQLKVEDILEPGGLVKVRDSSQDIGTHMTATLQDKASKSDRNFDIELVGGESNMRTYNEKKNKMVWQWNVTPRKEGNHDLILSISHVDKDGTDLGSPETRRHSITIFSSRKKPGLVSGVGDFIGKYWQWLLGAIALPIFIAWFTTRRRNPTTVRSNESPKTSSTAIKRKRRPR